MHEAKLAKKPLTSEENETSVKIAKYVNSIRSMGKSTALEYESRLRNFGKYVHEEYRISVDCLVERLLATGQEYQEMSPYDVLSEYTAHLVGKLSPNTIKQRIVTVKNFLEYCDVEISPRKYKLKVRLPRPVNKQNNLANALTRAQIVEILNACSDIRLKTYVMLLAATGMRASEALSIRICDLDFGSDPSRLFLRGEYTKTKTDRTVLLTSELANQLKNWLEYKYRTRRVTHHDNVKGKSVTEVKTPIRKNKDLVFSMSISLPRKGNEKYSYSAIKSIKYLYNDMIEMFGQTLNRIGKGNVREDLPGANRREIHLHLFRAFVKSTISDLGHTEFGEYHIGHKGSVYYRKSEKEKVEIFKKIEPYLTFLNIYQLERQGADLQSRIDELEDLNQSLRHRDQVKDDSIAQLSDQITALTVRLQVIEKRQNNH